MLFMTVPQSALQIISKIFWYYQVIIKSVSDPDNIFHMELEDEHAGVNHASGKALMRLEQVCVSGDSSLDI